MDKTVFGRAAWCAAVALLFASSASAMASPRVIEGVCRMDSCSWIKLLEKHAVKRDAVGTLIRARTEGGESEHPNGSYERKRPIKWSEPGDSFVLCSKVRPTVIFENENGTWNAVPLAPGYPETVSGPVTYAYKFYFLVCHGIEANLDDASLGRKFGYPRSLVSRAYERVTTLQSPEDILRP